MMNRANAYAEVYTILQDLNEEEYNKIPPEIIEAIEKNRNTEYEYELEEGLELKDQKLLPETRAILFNLFRDYLSTPEQKEKIIKMQNEERQENELKKKEKYSTDVFENRRQSNINNYSDSDKEENEITEIVEYKESFFKKIWNMFKNVFKHSK